MPHKTDLEIFAERLNRLLRESRESVSDATLARELSVRSGIALSGQAVWNWKHAKNWPKVPHLKALAEYLRMEPADLLFGAKPGGRSSIKELQEQYNALSLKDRHAIDKYAALNAKKRKLVRELIDVLGE